MYESKGCNSLLSFDEVQEMFTAEIRVVLVRAIISGRVDRWEEIVHSVCTSEAIEAGVFLKTPISVCLCGNASSFVLFDSHSHGERGALISVMSPEHAPHYLRHFFQGGVTHFRLLKLFDNWN